MDAKDQKQIPAIFIGGKLNGTLVSPSILLLSDYENFEGDTMFSRIRYRKCKGRRPEELGGDYIFYAANTLTNDQIDAGILNFFKSFMYKHMLTSNQPSDQAAP